MVIREASLPTEIEILQLYLHVATHSFNIHYNLDQMGIEIREDPDTPHDMANKGKKMEWRVSRGLALENRENGSELYPDLIKASVRYHRQQYHHRMWKNQSPDVPIESRKLSAADAVCSMLEPRKYQGGVHTWEQIEEKMATKSAPHQLSWMRYAFTEMRKIKQPNLAEITSFSRIPREGISPEMREAIEERVHQALHQLEQDHGYHFYENSESIIRKILE